MQLCNGFSDPKQVDDNHYSGLSSKILLLFFMLDISSSSVGVMCRVLWIATFGFLISTQMQISSLLGFGTTTTGDNHSVGPCTSSMIAASSSRRCISALTWNEGEMVYDNVCGLLPVQIYLCEDLPSWSVVFQVYFELHWGIHL